MSAFMPRPGQPGSLNIFTSENISDYLESFNAECELDGVKVTDMLHVSRITAIQRSKISSLCLMGMNPMIGINSKLR